MPLLHINSISVSYGRIDALRDVNIHIKQGEFVTLIGANGSGKSTLLKAILGLQRASKGSIMFMGRDITRSSTESIVAQGISLVPEGRGVLPLMTVEENLELGAYHLKGNIGDKLEAVFARFPILRERRAQKAGTLSGGQQQMLAIARGMIATPKILMMDEPSLGLAPIIVTELFNTIGKLKREGFTILLSEQNALKALAYADRGYVFEVGSVVLEGTAQELIDNAQVRAAYLGGTS